MNETSLGSDGNIHSLTLIGEFISYLITCYACLVVACLFLLSCTRVG